MSYTTWRCSRQNILRLTHITSSALCGYHPNCDTPLTSPCRSMWVAIKIHDNEAIYIRGTVLELHLKICTNHRKLLAVFSLLFPLLHEITEKQHKKGSNHLIHFGAPRQSHLLLHDSWKIFTHLFWKISIYRKSATSPGNHYPYCYKLLLNIHPIV